MLDICICSHNPRRDVLDLIIGSIVNQNSKERFNVCFIDNRSVPPLDPCVLRLLHRRALPLG